MQLKSERRVNPSLVVDDVEVAAIVERIRANIDQSVIAPAGNFGESALFSDVSIGESGVFKATQSQGGSVAVTVARPSRFSREMTAEQRQEGRRLIAAARKEQKAANWRRAQKAQQKAQNDALKVVPDAANDWRHLAHWDLRVEFPVRDAEGKVVSQRATFLADGKRMVLVSPKGAFLTNDVNRLLGIAFRLLAGHANFRYEVFNDTGERV